MQLLRDARQRRIRNRAVEDGHRGCSRERDISDAAPAAWQPIIAAAIARCNDGTPEGRWFLRNRNSRCSSVTTRLRLYRSAFSVVSVRHPEGAAR